MITGQLYEGSALVEVAEAIEDFEKKPKLLQLRVVDTFRFPDPLTVREIDPALVLITLVCVESDQVAISIDNDRAANELLELILSGIKHLNEMKHLQTADVREMIKVGSKLARLLTRIVADRFINAPFVAPLTKAHRRLTTIHFEIGLH